MPVDFASEREQYKVPNLPEAGPNVFFGDVLGNKGLTGSYFLLEGPNPSTPPKYTYDECGIVLKGQLTVRDDDSGASKHLKEGDTFFIHNGSTVTFTAGGSFALAWKISNRPCSNL